MTDPVRVLHRHDFQHLLNALASRGYRIVGPTVRDGAIVYEEIHAASDLPEGWTDRQDGGTYRLERRDDAALFGYTVGPHSWKKFLFPPRTRLWQADRQPQGFTLRPEPLDAAPYAFLGVRSCELHAIAIQDKVFMDTDPLYRAHRERAFLDRRELRPGGRDLLLRVHEDRPARRVWFRPRADRDSGRWPACVHGRGGLGAGQGGASDAADRGGWRGRSRGLRAVHRARGPADGSVHGRRRASPSCSPAISSTRAGTKWRRDAWPAPTARWSVRPVSAAPSRTRRISRAITPSGGDRGIRVSPWTSPTSTAGACARPRRRATGNG